MHYLKTGKFLGMKYTKDMPHILFQKLVAFMNQNYSKLVIAEDPKLKKVESEPHLVEDDLKRRSTLSSKLEQYKQVEAGD